MIRTAHRNPDTCIHLLQRSAKRGLYHLHCGWVVPPRNVPTMYRSIEDFREREGARIAARWGDASLSSYTHDYCLLCLKTPYGQSIVGAK